MISCTISKNLKHSKAIVFEDTNHAYAKVGSMQEGFKLKHSGNYAPFNNI
jgi:hypothetical protein